MTENIFILSRISQNSICYEEPLVSQGVFILYVCTSCVHRLVVT